MDWSKTALFKSGRMDWATPQPLFDSLDSEFNFQLDAAAADHNTKCGLFLSETQNALTVDWSDFMRQNGVDPATGAVWLNPPYGRTMGHWMRKVCEQAPHIQTIVCLVMARTCTKWWNAYAMRADEIRLVSGRVHFSGAAGAAPAPSAILVFDRRYHRPTFQTTTIARREKNDTRPPI